MATADERVRHWNTFLDFARDGAEAAYALATGKAAKRVRPTVGDFLPDDKAVVARALVMLCIAMEARANHMIDEAADAKRMNKCSDPEGAKKNNNFWQKWSNLAYWCGVVDRYRKTAQLHNVVKEVWEYRDVLMHAKFDGAKSLPDPAQVVDFYRRWIDSLADMNAILRNETPDPKIAALKEF